jgi:hypothetical protein
MMHTKTRIGKKLRTKCWLCVILPIDSAIKLKILPDNKVQKEQISLKRGYCSTVFRRNSQIGQWSKQAD